MNPGSASKIVSTLRLSEPVRIPCSVSQATNFARPRRFTSDSISNRRALVSRATKVIILAMKNINEPRIVSKKSAIMSESDAKQVWDVSLYPDWRKQARAFEAEMKKRGLIFKRIRWAK